MLPSAAMAIALFVIEQQGRGLLQPALFIMRHAQHQHRQMVHMFADNLLVPALILWSPPLCGPQNNSMPDSQRCNLPASHRDEDGGQVGGRGRVARLADAGQVEGVPQGLVELERPVQLHLQRVVRAQLDVLVLRQVAPAQPDGLTCWSTDRVERRNGSQRSPEHHMGCITRAYYAFANTSALA